MRGGTESARETESTRREKLSTLAIATAREVFDLLREDLVAVEQELGRDAASSVSTITEIAEYLREGGGKRIRPSLLLLAILLGLIITDFLLTIIVPRQPSDCASRHE